MRHGWATTNLDAKIAAHVATWERARLVNQPRPLATIPFITLSREFGCDALPLAQRIVSLFNQRDEPSIPWLAYDREVLDRVAQELHLRREIMDSLDGGRRDEMTELFDALLNRHVDEAVLFRKLAEVMRSLAIHGHAVLVGRGGHLLTHDLKTGLHVRLIAPREWRVRRFAAKRQVSFEIADRAVALGERERGHFLRSFFVIDPECPFVHDVLINNARHTVEQMAAIVVAALDARCNPDESDGCREP